MLRAVIWCAVSSEGQADEDKDSLPAQERDGLALCERNGWQVVDILRVPGHSRVYDDFFEMAADMRQQNIDAADRLFTLWETRGFDVLVCRDDDRFAREQSIHAYIVQRTIRAGARIYTMSSGWIDDTNYRMRIAMGGFKVASEIDALKSKREIGMKKRVELGLNTTGDVPLGFKMERKPYGTSLPDRIVHDPNKRQLLNDMAEVLKSRVGWTRFGSVLFERFGHFNQDTGKPYTSNTIRSFFLNPYTWGHTAYHYWRKYGLWAFDESLPVPEGVIVHRDKHEPLYTGELGEQVKAELRRRDGLSGRPALYEHYKFTGLMICSECGHAMVTNGRDYNRRTGEKTRYIRYYCNQARTYRLCDHKTYINEKTVIAYVNSMLEIILRDNSLESLLGQDTQALLTQRTSDLRRQIEDLEKHIDGLIANQATAPIILHERYTKQLNEAATQLETLRRNLAELKLRQPDRDRLNMQQTALSELQAISLPDFWQRSPLEINTRLRALFGNIRLVVAYSKVVGRTTK